MKSQEGHLNPALAANLEAYYLQSGASVPGMVEEMIETSFLPKIEGTLKPNEPVLLPATVGSSAQG